MKLHLMSRQAIPLLALALVLCLAGTALTPTPTPPGDWTINPASRHAYRVVAVQGVNWTTAKEQAATLTYDGKACYLATLTSAQESEFIAAHFAAQIGTEGFSFWLGGYQDAGVTPAKAGWKWVTGEAWSYTDWGIDEPNDFHGTASEQYLGLWGSQEPGEQSWNDELLESNIHGYMVECGDVWIQVQIDVRPGNSLNRVNLKSNADLPVALLTTPSFDARNADPRSVRFAGAAPLQWRLVDVDRDGDRDLLLRFHIKSLQLTQDSTRATLTGSTTSGLRFAGTDRVKILH